MDDSPSFDRAKAITALSTREFLPLLAAFDYHQVPSAHLGEGRLVHNLTFNPYSGITNAECRLREMAWHAAHEPEEFAEKMLSIVRQITNSPELTALCEELNRQCQLVPMNDGSI